MDIIVFSGTTEGRMLSEYLSENKIHHHVCVATESGAQVTQKNQYACIHVGRMDEEKIKVFFLSFPDPFVIDATHPYAEIVTSNLQKICLNLSIFYVRIIRECEPISDNQDIIFYNNTADCAANLKLCEGNILLTTGSKEVSVYAKNESLLERIYVRVLPSLDALKLCSDAKIPEKHTIAMYGPHTQEMNQATIRQFNIKHLVTKESGPSGGEAEKIRAAREEGCTIHVIKRPVEKDGVSLMVFLKNCNCITENISSKAFFEIVYADNKHVLLNNSENLSISNLSDNKMKFGIKTKNNPSFSLSISLIGIGMGDENTLTIGAKKAISQAKILFGASRMIAPYEKSHKTYPLYTAEKIIPVLEELSPLQENIQIAVLFSGDTSFYSGAVKLHDALQEWGKCSEIKILPGISSFAYFASLLGKSLTGARLESLHGKSEDQKNLQKIKSLIQNNEEIYLLLSGKQDIRIIEDLITTQKIDIGINLSYENQAIYHTTKDSLSDTVQKMADGLIILRIGNE